MSVPSPRTEVARYLRNNMTRVEWRLWARLRQRQQDGWKFRRQAPIGEYIVDFVCIQARLVVEVDGPGHDHRLDYDARRDLWLGTQGYRVLRVTAGDVDERLDEVMDEIRHWLDERPPARLRPTRTPHPRLLEGT